MRYSCLIKFYVSVLVLGSTANLSAQTTDLTGNSSDWTFGGHTKYQYIHTRIPANSVLHSISGDSLQDHNLDIRLKVSATRGRLDFNAHAQIIAVHSDSLPVLSELPGLFRPGADIANDDRRWFNLTHEISNANKNAGVVRLDRFSIAYTGDKTVVRFGRQALSWGNGLLFTPMDILNPFDPAAVDKEYKSGDDMLYGQYLLDNGSDFQGVTVVRRNPVSGDVEQDQSSLALKYHGFSGSLEYDLLAAQHYGEFVLGLGASADIGGAVWRADLVWDKTDSGSILSAVGGASYSGVAGGHNWTGFVEYFYSGFGQTNGNYSPEALVLNPELLKRLARGELFNLARHYLGASVSFEMTPLLNLTPNIFVNIIDPSALAQFILSYDWKQDIQVLVSLSIPIGPDGTEYGGIEAARPELYVSTGPSLFAQLAWYF